MKLDFTKYFNQYENIVKAADAAFENVKNRYPECVKCKVECCDCCHAMFDLTLIEALYINTRFNEKFKGPERKALLDKADKADRDAYKIKKRAYKESKEGKDTSDIIAEMSLERVKCPMLDAGNTCVIYEDRPITCRLYGIPTGIYEKGHTCGRSGFEPGIKYVSVKLDLIQKSLYDISQMLIDDIKSKYIKMADILVPLSSAILTEYDQKYLGIENG